MNRLTANTRLALLLVAAAALLAGVFFRFWNLGDAPLAVDEYFLGTSILNTAARGLPEFACGGYYTRGLLIQYLSVPLLWLGFPLEFTVRFWPAVASVLTVLALWRLGQRVGGAAAAALAVILASLSLWEVEFGRFGRMYAPFQALFAWYLYFQVRHLLDGREPARWAYLALSALAILTYEGAAMLLALNYLALVWPGRRWTIAHLLVSTGLLLAGLLFNSVDFRRYGVAPADLPPGWIPAPEDADTAASGIVLPIDMPPLPEGGLLLVVLALIAAAAIGLVLARRHAGSAAAHPATLFWLVALLSLAGGMVALGVALCAVGYLLRLPWPGRVPALRATQVIAAIAGIAAVWLAALTAVQLMGGSGPVESLKQAAMYVLNYPDAYYRIALPWLQTIPATTLLLGLLAAPAIYRAFRDEHAPELRYLVAVSVLMVLVAAVLPQPYNITRYTYFLYPAVLLLAATGIALVGRALSRQPLAAAATAFGAVLALFLLAEDFRLGHLFGINQPEYRFRTAYSPRLADHYYPRWDFRGAAEFVNERLGPNDRVIVFDQPLPHYLTRTDGIFVRYGSPIHGMIWGCGGRRDLWSNQPLLDQQSEFHGTVAAPSGHTWLVMRSDQYPWRDPLEVDLANQFASALAFTSLDGHLVVYRLEGTSDPPSSATP